MEYSKSKWASFTNKSNYGPSKLRIDPRFILQTMKKFGGLLLPKEVEDDLKVLERVCRCESSYLDIVNRELEIIDFIVYNNETSNITNPALKISKLVLKWDSYLTPCIDVHLENVEIFVEFLNLLLTKNNWNELADLGFPPTTYYDQLPETDASVASSDTFIRIGSLNLLGSVKLRIWSKPLNQSISPDFELNFASLKEVMDQIRTTTKTERKGRTTTQVYDILSNYTNTKIRQFIKTTIHDVAKTQILEKTKRQSIDETVSSIKHAKKLFSGATDVLRNYAQKTMDYTDAQFESNAKEKLKKWGLQNEDVESILEVSRVAASSALSSWSSQLRSSAFRDKSGGDMPMITISDDGDMVDYDEVTTTVDNKNEQLLHWFKTGYQAATEAAMNVFVDKMKEESSSGIGTDELIQPEEIFYPPF